MDDCTERRQAITSVQLPQLPAQTILLVRTMHSLYRVVVIDGSDVRVQGGSYFPEPVIVALGSRSADGVLLPSRIEVGLRMAMCLGALHVVTSPVRAISDEGSETELAELCAMTRHEATRLLDWGA